MSPEQFVYWLQGYVEINGNPGLSPAHWQVIKDHLQTVFKKETPKRNPLERINDELGKLPNPDPGIHPVPMPTYPPREIDPNKWPNDIAPRIIC